VKYTIIKYGGHLHFTKPGLIKIAGSNGNKAGWCDFSSTSLFKLLKQAIINIFFNKMNNITAI
jgi:hypothetical protein